MFVAEVFATMDELVDTLKRSNIIKSREVEEVMRRVDRKHFLDVNPYEDAPQSIGSGATISAPHMHAFALEMLKGHLKGAGKCLDVGYGSGYMTVAMRLLMKDMKNGVVFGIDHVRSFLPQAEDNLISAGFEEWLLEYKVVFMTGDGRKGIKRQRRFDCIHVGAAFDKYPKELEEQLALGGRMVLPVGPQGKQKFLIVDKDLDGKVSKSEVMDVSYVPMTDLEQQCIECYVAEQEHLKKLKQSEDTDILFDDL